MYKNNYDKNDNARNMMGLKVVSCGGLGLNPGAALLKVPEHFCTRKALTKSQYRFLLLQSCFICVC